MEVKYIKHGMEWGSSKMTFLFDDDNKQWVTWGLRTPKNSLQIYVTKTGKVRIHDKRGEWTPPNEK